METEIKLARASFETLIQSSLMLLLVNVLECAGISMLHSESPLGIFRSSAEFGIAVAVMFIGTLFITNIIFWGDRMQSGSRRLKSLTGLALGETTFFFCVFFTTIYILGAIDLFVLTIEGLVSFILATFAILFLTNLAYSRWLARPEKTKSRSRDELFEF